MQLCSSVLVQKYSRVEVQCYSSVAVWQFCLYRSIKMQPVQQCSSITVQQCSNITVKHLQCSATVQQLYFCRRFQCTYIIVHTYNNALVQQCSSIKTQQYKRCLCITNTVWSRVIYHLYVFSSATVQQCRTKQCRHGTK